MIHKVTAGNTKWRSTSANTRKLPFNKESINKILDYEKILNGINIYIDIYENGFYKETIKAEKIVTIPLNNSYYHFDIYYKYTNGFLDGVKTALDIYL